MLHHRAHRKWYRWSFGCVTCIKGDRTELTLNNKKKNQAFHVLCCVWYPHKQGKTTGKLKVEGNIGNRKEAYRKEGVNMGRRGMNNMFMHLVCRNLTRHP